MTGAPQPIINPITGTRMLWSGGRYGKGCGDVIAGHHLLLFRAFSQGYYDLERHSGSSYLPGFRPACYTSSIPGCGVLGVPHYSQACGCVPRSTSIGLIHMPELETWHIYATKPMLKKYYHGTIPIQHLAVNLGAPGDRCSADGALWLNYKSSKAKDEATVQDPFLGPLLKIEPGQAEYFRNHSSCMSEKRLNWIGASGVTGLESVQISLGADAAKTPYTVRLYLAEPEQSAASGRVFSVTIQGQEVLKDFSVAGTARGPRKTIMREFKGITVKDKLLLTFRKAANAKLPPVLNGIELIAEAANADATPTPK